MTEGRIRKATVIDGSVEIRDTVYYPCQEDGQYDGRLDGKVCWFISYSFGLYACFYGVEDVMDRTPYPWEWWWPKKGVGNVRAK